MMETSYQSIHGNINADCTSITLFANFLDLTMNSVHDNLWRFYKKNMRENVSNSNK